MKKRHSEKPHVIVIVPTYNERENIQELLPALLKLPNRIHDIHVLIVDDNSPDKTWHVVQEWAKKSKRVHLLRRFTNKGRGTAGIAGYRWALQHGADLILEMDADFSHPPKVIPALLQKLQTSNVVLASRFIGHGLDVDRHIFRQLLTVSSVLYVRLLLGISLRDINSGFRGFQRHVLTSILPFLTARNSDIVQEVFYLCHLHGYTMHEIPLVFKDRKHGETKKTFLDFWNVGIAMLKLKWRHLHGEI